MLTIENEKIFTKDYTLFNINHVPLCYYYLTFACNRSNLFRTIIEIIMSAPKCNLFHWFEVQFPKSSIVLVCPLWYKNVDFLNELQNVFMIIDSLCRNLIKICKMYFKKNVILDKQFLNWNTFRALYNIYRN